MKFCDTCHSNLKKKNNYKCFTCNGDSISDNNNNLDEIADSSSFPFKKEKYYGQQDIRDKCHTHQQQGIIYNSIYRYWVIIKNKKSKSNIYDDRVGKDGIYRYTGQGLTGDQTMTGKNDKLKNAESNGQKIHLFWQYNQNSDHKYAGEVKIVRIDDETQLGRDKRYRDVFVFSLQPVD